MMDWQRQQGAACGCRGHDEMCPCQNVSPADRSQDPFRKAERALLGGRWSDAEADELIRLIEMGRMAGA